MSCSAMPNDPGSHQEVLRSLFVGITSNKGQRVPDLAWDPVLNRTHFGDIRFPIRGAYHSILNDFI